MKISCLPWLKKLLAIITLALLALGLQGCSTLRLAYSNAPTAAYWYLDGYLDFNDAQAPAVRSALAQIHRWHQQTQLPAYLQTLNRLQAQVAHDITPVQACTIYSQVQNTLVDTGEGMADMLQMAALHTAGTVQVSGSANPAAVLATLDARQLQHLERKFIKSNAEYRKDFMDGSPARQRDKRLERTVSRAETFYGQLDKRQQDLLAERLAQSGWQPELAYAERVRRQQDLLQTLKALAGGTTYQTSQAGTRDASLKAVLARWADSPDPRYREQSQAMRLHSCETLAALHNSTSIKQRQHAAATLQSYAQDLQSVRKG
jgi:hypothetical protein